jgi:hypothetical protein
MEITSSTRVADGRREMKQGILYIGRSSSAMRDVLTWHDIGAMRVWLHTRKSQGSARNLIGFCIQQFEGSPPKVSSEEKRTRLRLASIQEFQGSRELTATALRSVALGELSESHAASIFQVLSKLDESGNKRVSLTSEFTSKDVTRKATFRFDSSREISNLGANSKDALLIAKVYTQISESGVKNVAKRCAQALNVDTELIYVALRVARRNDWLTSMGSGKSGGRMTEKGEKEFRKSKGHERLARLMSADWIYTD